MGDGAEIPKTKRDIKRALERLTIKPPPDPITAAREAGKGVLAAVNAERLRTPRPTKRAPHE